VLVSETFGVALSGNGSLQAVGEEGDLTFWGFFFVPRHYNFPTFEKHHYNSCFCKFSITILLVPHPCPFLRWNVPGPTCRRRISVLPRIAPG